MGRITWVCATCSQPFTRRTSATRHDNNKHRGQAEIVPLLEYIVGRGTGQYMSSKPLSYGHHQKWQVHNSNSGFGPPTVANSAGDRVHVWKRPAKTTPRQYVQTLTLFHYSLVGICAFG